MLPNRLQVSIHECPRSLVTEMQLVIPPAAELLGKCGRDGHPPLLAIPTAQRTTTDLSEWGDKAAKEKDDCLERVR